MKCRKQATSGFLFLESQIAPYENLRDLLVLPMGRAFFSRAQSGIRLVAHSRPDFGLSGGSAARVR